MLAEDMLTKLGFSDWGFVFGGDKFKPYWKNIHDDWIKMLETPTPFLILEDDATITDYYHPEVEYPEDTQLLYLGGTTNGEDCVFPDGLDLLPSQGSKDVFAWMVYSEYDDRYIRIYNMHSTHAILFLNEDVKRQLQSAINDMRDLAVDVVIARNMRKYKIYCLKQPFWYQKDGWNDERTMRYYK